MLKLGLLDDDYCDYCLRRIAIDEDYDAYAPGEGAHLCWGDMQCRQGSLSPKEAYNKGIEKLKSCQEVRDRYGENREFWELQHRKVADWHSEAITELEARAQLATLAEAAQADALAATIEAVLAQVNDTRVKADDMDAAQFGMFALAVLADLGMQLDATDAARILSERDERVRREERLTCRTYVDQWAEGRTGIDPDCILPCAGRNPEGGE